MRVSLILILLGGVLMYFGINPFFDYFNEYKHINDLVENMAVNPEITSEIVTIQNIDESLVTLIFSFATVFFLFGTLLLYVGFRGLINSF